MSDQQTINVEVAYAKPEKQVLLSVRVKPGTTLIEAIRLSGVLEQFPEIDLAAAKFGIFSKISAPETVLRELDRIEIYRPLIADPKESRRKRADKKHAREEAKDAGA
jgi:putative ubiquitin-RnfH superfamily antitoxin RatB of RatAB toxin-antitoxin module